MAKKKEDKLDQILYKLDEHGRKLGEHDKKFNGINDSMLSHFDKIYGRLGDLRQEYHLVNGALRRIENSMLPRIEKLEEKVGVS